MQPGLLRAFVSIAPDDRFIPALAAIQAELRALPGGDQVRWTRADQIHLTLRFIGELPTDQSDSVVQRLSNACGRCQPFPLEFGEMGCFPGSRRPRIIWLGLQGSIESLLALQRNVATALAGFGDPQDDKPFRPHLTLGRVLKNTRRLAFLESQLPNVANPGPWLVKSVLFMRSELHPQGARHTVLFEQPLHPAARQ